MLNTRAAWSEEKKDSIKQKTHITMINKSPKETAEIRKKKSEASIRNWNNSSEEFKRKRAEISRENALK